MSGAAPPPTASLLTLIAQATSWPRDFILWDLSLSQAYAIEHSYMMMKGIKMQKKDLEGRAQLRIILDKM